MSKAVVLPARLDADAACTLWPQLRGMQGDIEIDARGLRHIGAAGLQLLLVCAAMRSRTGERFVILQPTPGICDALAALGAADRFEIVPAAAGGVAA